MRLLGHVVLIYALLATVTAKSFLQQLLSWDFELAKGTEQRDAEEEPAPISNCVCDGPGCICCSDFNLTYIDLGGPGCVRLKYLSPEEGMAVNVSYGDSLLHSEVVKGPNPEPTCMNLLTDLAQICARFIELQPTAEGIRGCLNLEPRILGESQADYELGCFRVGPGGMTFDPPPNNTRPASAKPASASTEKPATGGEEEAGPTEEEVIAAVSETAEQGLAFLSSLLGLDLGSETASETAETAAAPSTSTAAAGSTSVVPEVVSTEASPADTASQGRAYSNPLLNEVF